MAAAELEAAKNSWQVAVTILDSGGNMVMFHKLDNTQLASIGVSEGKANTALQFKRPSKALDDVIAADGAGLRLLAVKDITPLEGGLPVILDGTIIGAIGVSGHVAEIVAVHVRRRLEAGIVEIPQHRLLSRMVHRVSVLRCLPQFSFCSVAACAGLAADECGGRSIARAPGQLASANGG